MKKRKLTENSIYLECYRGNIIITNFKSCPVCLSEDISKFSEVDNNEVYNCNVCKETFTLRKWRNNEKDIQRG